MSPTCLYSCMRRPEPGLQGLLAEQILHLFKCSKCSLKKPIACQSNRQANGFLSGHLEHLLRCRICSANLAAEEKQQLLLMKLLSELSQNHFKQGRPYLSVLAGRLCSSAIREAACDRSMVPEGQQNKKKSTTSAAEPAARVICREADKRRMEGLRVANVPVLMGEKARKSEDKARRSTRSRCCKDSWLSRSFIFSSAPSVRSKSRSPATAEPNASRGEVIRALKTKPERLGCASALNYVAEGNQKHFL